MEQRLQGVAESEPTVKCFTGAQCQTRTGGSSLRLLTVGGPGAASGQKEGDYCLMSRVTYDLSDDMISFTGLSGWAPGVRPSIL